MRSERTSLKQNNAPASVAVVSPPPVDRSLSLAPPVTISAAGRCGYPRGGRPPQCGRFASRRIAISAEAAPAFSGRGRAPCHSERARAIAP